MKALNITAAIVICLLTACSTTDEHIQKINIDNVKVSKTLDISNQIKNIQITELKEEPGSYLGSVWKLFVIRGNIIAYDRFQTHKVNLFNSEGKFLKTILKTGDGPQDAFQINDLYINNVGNLEAYDFAAKKIYKYNEDFNLIKIQRFTESNIYKSVQTTGKGYVVYAAFNEYNQKEKGKSYHLAFLDNNFNIKSTSIDYEKRFEGIEWLVFKNSFSSFQDSLRFLQAYDPYVYNISPRDEISKRFKIVYKKKSLPDNVFDNIVSDHIAKFKDRNASPFELNQYFSGYAAFEGTWLESIDKIFLLSKNFDGYPFVTFVDKKKSFETKSAAVLSESLTYKLTLPYFDYYYKEDNSYFSVISGSNLLKYYIKQNSPLFGKIKNDAEILYVIKTQFK